MPFNFCPKRDASFWENGSELKRFVLELQTGGFADYICVISSDINMILKPACKIRFSDVSGEILLISLFIKLLLFSLLYKYFPLQ